MPTSIEPVLAASHGQIRRACDTFERLPPASTEAPVATIAAAAGIVSPPLDLTVSGTGLLYTI